MAYFKSMNTHKKTSPHSKPKTTLVNLFASSYDVYIGSPTSGADPRTLQPGEYGFLGNPFCSGSVVENNQKFRDYFLERVKTDIYFNRAVTALYGKRLGCLGNPRNSHGNIILDWLNDPGQVQRKRYEKVFGIYQKPRL